MCVCVCMRVYPRACASLGSCLVLLLDGPGYIKHLNENERESDAEWRDAGMERASERKVFEIRLIDERDGDVEGLGV